MELFVLDVCADLEILFSFVFQAKGDDLSISFLAKSMIFCSAGISIVFCETLHSCNLMHLSDVCVMVGFMFSEKHLKSK